MMVAAGINSEVNKNILSANLWRSAPKVIGIDFIMQQNNCSGTVSPVSASAETSLQNSSQPHKIKENKECIFTYNKQMPVLIMNKCLFKINKILIRGSGAYAQPN